MNQPNHDHGHHGHHNDQHSHSKANAPWRPHHDWRFWAAVVLMLAGMAAYVLSMDESLRPGGVKPAQPSIPVGAGGAAG
jgi:hypothetical protein